MSARRMAARMALALLLAAAGVAAWRSARPQPETAATVAAGLVCPSCQGETVAQSPSPMAAAMRDTIADQLAAGRTADQVRQWFVERYGPAVLADPSRGGLGVVLWVLPGTVALAAVALAVRACRRRATPAPPAGKADTPAPGWRKRRAKRLWDAMAVGLVGLVAAVAIASPHRAAPAAAGSAATTLVTLARSLEGKGRYAEAAEVYREALQQQPDDRTRLRLALALLRAHRPADAEKAARQVLDRSPHDHQAILILGLAQRAQGAPTATATLRRFLALAPRDPAAAEIRRLLHAG